MYGKYKRIILDTTIYNVSIHYYRKLNKQIKLYILQENFQQLSENVLN